MGNNEWAIPFNKGKLCVKPMFENQRKKLQNVVG